MHRGILYSPIKSLKDAIFWKKNETSFSLKIGMPLRGVGGVASNTSRRSYRKAVVGFRMLRDSPPRPAFTSFPSSFDYDVTSRRGIRLCQGYDLTRAATVALGVERGNTARFPQC